MSATGTPEPRGPVLVLLCGSLRTLGTGLDLDAISGRVEETRPGTRVVIVPDLCNKPKALADSSGGAAHAAVLGLCSSEYREPEFQRSARKAGIDQLAIAAVNLGSYCARLSSSAQAGTDRAIGLIGAAIARVQAFPGSQPENVRPYLLGDDQKISRRALFTLPPIAYRPVVAIDRTKCAADRGCQECVQVCPTDALTSVEGKIAIVRRNCEACGICESTCPTSAASVPGHTLPQLEAEANELLSDPVLDQAAGRAILFVCHRSAGKIDSLAEASLITADRWLPVSVPCAGSVSPAMLLQSIAHGAAAAAVLGCGEYCEFGQQERTTGKVDYCQQALISLGRSPEAVNFLDASLPKGDLAEALNRALPDTSREPADRAASVSFAGPEAVARALLALAPATDQDRSLEVTHPSSPLGFASVDASGCTGCGSCVQYCPTGALNLSEREGTVALSYDSSLCTGCSQCVSACPEHVVTVELSTDISRLREGRTTLYEDDTVRCESCGAAVGPAAMLRRIEELISSDDQHPGESAMAAIKRLCSNCRSVGAAIPRQHQGPDELDGP